MLTVDDYHSHARRIFSKVSLNSIVLIKKPNKKGIWTIETKDHKTPV